jgi:hypothetical protein
MPIDAKALSAYAGKDEEPAEEEAPETEPSEEELDADEPEDRPDAAERLMGAYASLLSAAEDVGDELANDGSPLEEGLESDLLDALDSLDDETLLALADLQEGGISDYTTMVLTMQAANEEAPDTDAARLVGALLYHARMALTASAPVIETEEEVEEETEEELAEEEEEVVEEETTEEEV